MALDIFSPIFQLKAIKQMAVIPTFLMEVFVMEGQAVPQERATWDYKKGTNRMAPFVGKNAGGVNTSRTGYNTYDVRFPKIAPERPVTMDDLAGRIFAENIVSDMTPEERALKIMAEDLQEMRGEIAATKEWMVSQILFYGKMDILEYVDGGRVQTAPDFVDYGFTQNFTADAGWDETGGDPVADMEEMHHMVLQGQGAVDIIIMAADVKAALYNNEKYLAKLDNLRFNAGLIKPSFQGQSLLYIGVNHLGVPMYEYTGKVTDYTGNAVSLVPDGKILMGSRKMLKSLYGPITQVEGEAKLHKTYLEKEVPLRYSSIESNSVKQRLTSRPMIIPFNVDAWVVGDVLA